MILALEVEIGVMAALVQHPAVTRNRGLVEPHELTALGTKGSLTVDGHDGLALG